MTAYEKLLYAIAAELGLELPDIFEAMEPAVIARIRELRANAKE